MAGESVFAVIHGLASQQIRTALARFSPENLSFQRSDSSTTRFISLLTRLQLQIGAHFGNYEGDCSKSEGWDAASQSPDILGRYCLGFERRDLNPDADVKVLTGLHGVE
eukprot:1980593-Rhodomonas_salina.2